MTRLRMPTVLCLVLLASLLDGKSCAGQHVAIADVIAEFADELVAESEGKSIVVACRWIGATPVHWNPHEALATEVTYLLCFRNVDAIRYASDHRIEKLADKRALFTRDDLEALDVVQRDCLLAIELDDRTRKCRFRLLEKDVEEPLWQTTITIPASALELSSNIPELNQQVVDYCKKHEGKMVGKGVCSTLPKYALKEIGANQPGVYTWGRELDAREPVLPGDVLQMELVRYRGKGFSKNYTHHTAVVTDVTPTHLVVHHQNVGKLGKVVQREEIPRNAKQFGIVQAYRPWIGDSPMPPLSPRRKESANLVERDGKVNLLATLHPRLDSVKGIWFRDDGGLKWNRDTFARLQVPVEPPESYTLNLRVKRLFGSDGIGIGVVVGGQQVQVVVDGYKGTISGLNMVDGKKCKANSSTYKGNVIGENQTVDLEIQVTGQSVQLLADGTTIFHWEGNPDQLSVQDSYQVPNKQWLFLTSYNTQFHLTSFTMEAKE